MVDAGLYPEPYSLYPLTAPTRANVAGVGSVALISLLATALVLLGLSFKWTFQRPQDVEQRARYQSFMLLTNLLVADLIQACGFVIDLHWINVNGIIAPSAACWIQGALIHLGDVSSGAFVLAIAIHTTFTLLGKLRLNTIGFDCIVVGIWLFALVLTLIGPLSKGADFFTRAGNWCWISTKYEGERLTLHYVWIFLFEFGSIVLYAGLFFLLRRYWMRSQSSGAPSAKVDLIARTGRYMLIYPVIYVAMTLPLATARMMKYAGREPSDLFFAVAGCMLTSCGLLDAVVYSFTRNVFTTKERGGSVSYPLSASKSRDTTEDTLALTSQMDVQSMSSKVSKG